MKLLLPALSGCELVRDVDAVVPSGMRSAEASRRSVHRSADGWACAADPGSYPAAVAAEVVAAAAAASLDRVFAGCEGEKDWAYWDCEA